MASLNVLAIDPGITTGYCLSSITDEGTSVFAYQHKHEVWEHYAHLMEVDPDIIICEDFHYRKGQRDNLILFSVQLIGVMRLWAKYRDRPVVMQLPSTGKAFYSNDQLREKGVYKRGVPHGMDATRHLLHWFTFGAGFQYVKPDDVLTRV